MKQLSAILREHRRASGLSRAALARFAGVGKTVIFDVENGKTSVRYDTLLKIFDVLNISLRFESPFLSQPPGATVPTSSEIPEDAP